MKIKTVGIIIALLLGAVIIFLIIDRKDKSKTIQTNTEAVKTDSDSQKTEDNDNDNNLILFAINNTGNNVYKVKRGDKWAVVFNGEEGNPYNSVSNPTISSDGSSLAYIADNGDDTVVVVDGNEEVVSDEISDIKFTEDGEVDVIIIDEQEESSNDNVGSSSDGNASSVPGQNTNTENPTYIICEEENDICNF